MPKKRFSAEQIVVVLRQIEVLLSQGKSPPVACREAGISQQSYYRWRGRVSDEAGDATRMVRELTSEVERLKQCLAEVMLDCQMLREVAKKKW